MARSTGSMRIALGVVAGVATVALALAAPAVGEAAAPSVFWQTPDAGADEEGAGAGQSKNVRAIAVDPNVPGHIYVTEWGNDRVSEYTAWGEFLRTWGWDVVAAGPDDTPADEFEICDVEENPMDICKAGVAGSAANQFDHPSGIEVDDSGAVYVYENGNRRVQKFSTTKEFLWMAGGEVNKTKSAEGGTTEAERNLCTAESEDNCGKGVEGTGSAQFAKSKGGEDFLAIGPGDTVYVGDYGRIQELNADGTYKEDFPAPGGSVLEGNSVGTLDVDASGNVYVTFRVNSGSGTGQPNAYKLTPAGEPGTPAVFPALAATAVRLGPGGMVYVMNNGANWDVGVGVGEQELYGYEPDGTCIPGMCEGDEFGHIEDLPAEGQATAIPAIETGELCGGLYMTHWGNGIAPSNPILSYLIAYGTVPDPELCGDPPPADPTIENTFTSSVGTDAATVQAKINPKFWSDTTYYVQYGTSPCSEGGCEQTALYPGRTLTDEVVSVAIKAPAQLAELTPDTIYYYRFAAASGGGGPVEGAEASFRTFAAEATNSSCPNSAFRSGAGTSLPDCRAYELVSPLDKNGGDAGAVGRGTIVYSQAATSGDKFLYSAVTAFSEPEGAPFQSQYVGNRGVSGWSSEAVSPPRGEPLTHTGFLIPTAGYNQLSPDLCTGWLLHSSATPLVLAAPTGFVDLYRRDLCGAGPWEPLNEVTPTNQISDDFLTELQGSSADGSRAIFVAHDQLAPEALSGEGEREQLYEWHEGTVRPVCFTPGGTISPLDCMPGWGSTQNLSAYRAVERSISADGERIFFTTYDANPASGSPKLYVRVGGTETREISETVSAEAARFWTAAVDGSVAIFTIGGTIEGPKAEGSDLYSFDVDTATPTEIAGGALGVVGASEDASRVYFVSREAKAAGAEAGDANLYLYEAPGGYRFIAKLASIDAQADADLSADNLIPVRRSSRLTPDGSHLVFMSTEPLTGQDNTDAVSGEPDTNVFRYDAVGEQLSCLSCIPTGARPRGSLAIGGEVWASGQIAPWSTGLYPARVISDDGQRVFFESYDRLVPGDLNGKLDVYQWEEEGKGDCEEEGGCVRLISSGEDSRPSYFLDASPSGDDVFISTAASLVGIDTDAVDVYDARVEGGFAYPASAADCEGDSCQSPAGAPAIPNPASSSFQGPGNLKQKWAKRCPKGKRKVKRKGKVRCVRKHKKQKRRNRRHRVHRRKRTGR